MLIYLYFCTKKASMCCSVYMLLKLQSIINIFVKMQILKFGLFYTYFAILGLQQCALIRLSIHSSIYNKLLGHVPVQTSYDYDRAN